MTPFAYYGLSFNPFDKQAILDSAVLSAVHSHTNGNPRLIDNLMTDALTLGSQMDKKTIDAEVILAAVSGQNLA